ncbi:hypothetical protein [Pseudoduganella albidiflava]|uniref:Uncharacterized protein n=1 Tax=Pseudoduganella albidiflava TaxID=321983 RepID=A0A411X300_9BURK|nr:hypothetical protein [Pseudoduganella albidiflava]QBI03278.1 hypothetical protein EYF70_22455 [Pseudoduganella albidiflava]GGY68149.1 hypothetical protein GCM10007387_57920 [Pseudoduganella albidiflava]
MKYVNPIKLAEMISNIWIPDKIPVYKFLSRKYFDMFFETGNLRLGTTGDFADGIAHGAARLDREEGRHRTEIRLAEHHYGSGGPDAYLDRVFSGLNDGIAFKNLNLSMQHTFPDSHVYCASMYYNEAIFQRWHTEEGTDTCFEIFDFMGFLDAITKKLSRDRFFFGAGQIDYIEGAQSYDSKYVDFPSVFVKQAEKFSWQVEGRGVWVQRGPYLRITSMVVDVPDARQFCRPFAVLKEGIITYL